MEYCIIASVNNNAKIKTEQSNMVIFEFFYNMSIPAKSLQDSASIDIVWLQPIECQS